MHRRLFQTWWVHEEKSSVRTRSVFRFKKRWYAARDRFGPFLAAPTGRYRIVMTLSSESRAAK